MQKTRKGDSSCFPDRLWCIRTYLQEQVHSSILVPLGDWGSPKGWVKATFGGCCRDWDVAGDALLCWDTGSTVVLKIKQANLVCITGSNAWVPFFLR